MGIRSMNYVVLKPGIALSDAVGRYLNNDTATIIADERGTLVVYESNFTPMWARDGRGENCTLDLEEEIAVHRYLGSLSPDAFFMKRVGEECGTRGQWEDHTFRNHAEVLRIEMGSEEATRFNSLFADVVSGLMEYHPILKNLALIDELKPSFLAVCRDTGNDQADYEHLHDCVENKLNNLSWDDIPAGDQARLIDSLGQPAGYFPTDEELNDLWHAWYRGHEEQAA